MKNGVAKKLLLIKSERNPVQIYLMESSLSNSSSPIVFSHNDAMPANMVRTHTGWFLTLFTPGGGISAPPFQCICVYMCKYTYERFEKFDFSQNRVWKRAVRFLSRKIISFCLKKSSLSELPEFRKGGPL